MYMLPGKTTVIVNKHKLIISVHIFSIEIYFNTFILIHLLPALTMHCIELKLYYISTMNFYSHRKDLSILNIRPCS